ncbi:glycerol-3-phosphate dehydrogenase [Hypnocyclicus thermotrophus]|uniref:Glycerol-3-phosphate dehydrogenase n=1 Tax=Hypnocyclicus thermotrophus TaxID=1627895 RepID=A0AA46I544_9FUSO|nr:FAD-dependent oxidoreductase [Hypnocyclicus thermotrophus]TDT68087.1 glycerol-3-phosphate dehydrogenase [Hypnocyclicus thermotrophus]
MYDIIIIGAGVIGSLIARELSKYNIKIALLEKNDDVSCGASKANSGIIHGGYDAKHGTLKSKLSYKGNQMYDKLNSELNFGFERIGSLVVGYNEEDLKSLKKLIENGVKNGVKNLKLLTKEKIKEIEPNINDNVQYAVYCSDVGIVSPYEVTIAAAENAIKNGVKLFLNSEVISIKKDEFFIVETQKKIFKTRYIINCAGLYSDKIANMVGIDDFYIIPRKGEYMLFEKYYGDIVNHVIFQVPTVHGKGVLVTKTYHNNLMIGPNAQEINTKDDKSTSLENLKSIYIKSKNSIPNIDYKKIIRSFAGIRATSNKHDFIIEESKIKNFINVAGIESPGLTSAPAIAQMVENILLNKESFKKNKKYNPYRKFIVKKKTKDELLSNTELKPLLDNETYICRCEQVSKEIILDALSRGIEVKSVDGIKRRTRAGMGICQGNFCSSRVKKIISKYYNIPIETVKDREEASGIINERVNRIEILKNFK